LRKDLVREMDRVPVLHWAFDRCGVHWVRLAHNFKEPCGEWGRGTFLLHAIHVSVLMAAQGDNHIATHPPKIDKGDWKLAFPSSKVVRGNVGILEIVVPPASGLDDEGLREREAPLSQFLQALLIVDIKHHEARDRPTGHADIGVRPLCPPSP